jgi:organic hydroperoxide reductase OsmC/OhrA
VDVDLRATFDSADKHNLPGQGAAFELVTIKLNIKSPSPTEMVEKLIRHAERGCHAAQSLRKPVHVTLEAVINDEIKIQPNEGQG